MPDVAGLVGELLEIVRPDHGADAGRGARRRQVDTCYSRARVGRPQHRRVQHPGQLEIGGVWRLATRALRSVQARHPLTDGLEWTLRPLVERVLVDDYPPLGVLPFDFFLG